MRRSGGKQFFPKFPTQTPHIDGWAGSQISHLYMIDLRVEEVNMEKMPQIRQKNVYFFIYFGVW